MNKKDILRTISFGSNVAEQEQKELSEYFVNTVNWDYLKTDQ